MTTMLHNTRLVGDRGSTGGEPAAQNPGLWSVVQRAHHARLIYPGGPDYRCLIVDYVVAGSGIELEVPVRDVIPGELDDRVITLEILDDYLSSTVEHVHVVGRVLEGDHGAAGVGRVRGWSGMPRSVFVVAVLPLELQTEA